MEEMNIIVIFLKLPLWGDVVGLHTNNTKDGLLRSGQGMSESQPTVSAARLQMEGQQGKGQCPPSHAHPPKPDRKLGGPGGGSSSFPIIKRTFCIHNLPLSFLFCFVLLFIPGICPHRL